MNTEKSEIFPTEDVEGTSQCAWCGTILGTTMVRANQENLTEKPTSHGICRPCTDKFMRSYEESKNAK